MKQLAPPLALLVSALFVVVAILSPETAIAASPVFLGVVCVAHPHVHRAVRRRTLA